MNSNLNFSLDKKRITNSLFLDTKIQKLYLTFSHQKFEKADNRNFQLFDNTLGGVI